MTRVRPTTQKAKEALFNILGDKTKQAKVLDLFAGNGNIGIEALSRGAKEVVFVDNNFVCINAIKQGLRKLNFLSVSNVIYSDFEKAVSFFSRKKEKFNIIFADPPYSQKFGEKILRKISRCDILSVDGLLIIEHFKKEILPSEAGNLILKQQKRYGDTILSLYEFCSKNSKH